jgi:ElaA protein
MNWNCKTFESLTTAEIYKILALRSEVFVVEQTCIYQDIDGKDEKAMHLFATENGAILAYARLFKAGDYFDEASIGRVIVHPQYRGKDWGHQLMKKALQYMDQNHYGSIHISAQKYLENFYKTHGFVVVSSEYLEDGIPHIGMEKHNV